jgi:hypothetical protein
MMLSLRILLVLAAFPAIASAQWEPARKLSTTDTSARLNENIGRCIAVSGDSVHVVWSDAKMGGSTVYYRHSFDAGITWSAPILIPGASELADFTSIAVSGNTVHVTYRDQVSGVYKSYYSRSTDGGTTWDARVLLGTYYFWPSIACDGPNVFVGLNSSVTGNSEVWLRRSTDNGATWDSAIQISRALGRSEDQSVATSAGHVYLVWNDNRDSMNGVPKMQAYYRHSSNNGVTWGSETLLNQPPTGSYFPFISADGSNVDFTWGDRRGQFQVFYKHSSDHGATWSSEQLLSSPTLVGAYPMVVRRGSNVYLVHTYFSGDAVYHHSGDGGATWDSAETLAPASYKPVATFIAVTDSIQHVIWVDQRDGHPGVYYTRQVQHPVIGGTPKFASLNYISFDTVAMKLSKDTAIVLRNIGSTPLHISSYSLHGSPFEFFDTTLHDIPSHDSIIIRLRFMASMRGEFWDSLIIQTDEPARYAIGLRAVSLTIMQLSATPLILDFGDVDSGSAKRATIMFVNYGDLSGRVDSFSILGSTMFTVDSSAPLPMRVASSTEFKIAISFRPTRSGVASSNLFVVDNYGREPFALTLSGNGVGKKDTSTGDPKEEVAYALPSEGIQLTHGNNYRLHLHIPKPLGEVQESLYDLTGRMIWSNVVDELPAGNWDLPIMRNTPSPSILRFTSHGEMIGTWLVAP